jgi:hypothetical protein
MDNMDTVRERIEALEQQMRAMGAHTGVAGVISGKFSVREMATK